MPRSSGRSGRGPRKNGRRAKKGARRPSDRAPAAAAGGQERMHTEYELSNEVIEAALLTGEHAGLLEDYFGPENYRELRQLEREARSRGVRGGPRVLILPGIMGSKLGRRRKGPFDDVLWLDPFDIAQGRLADLALGTRAAAVEPLGVILLYYLKLKLRLRAAGYDADFYPFDWRRNIAELGAQLAAVLKQDRNVSIVAHSMGGLVARWALGKGGGRCQRLIMLGTPNAGSFAPLMALRAAYPVVRRVGSLDLRHSPEELARDVFSTFPGLTQMFPPADAGTDLDIFDLDQWPDDDLRPRQPLLDTVQPVRGELAAAADEFALIVGVDQETPVGVRAGADGFDFAFSAEGDGTVPLELARMAGIRTYYVAEKHGSLANNRIVGKAVIDLLTRGETRELPSAYSPARRAVRFRSEGELRVDPYEGRRGGLLSQNELRHLLDEFASPDAREEVSAVAVESTTGLPTAPAELGYRHRFERVVVGRRHQHRIDLRFAFGSITEADSRALALGIFKDVAPAGAAAALDRRLGGAITELSRRRMFSGNVGEIFIMPTGRHALPAELIAFVGLGAFDRFNDEVLQTAAENVIRTFVNTRVEEFATVLFGGGSGEHPASGLRNLLTGFFRGLCDADRDHHFRRLVVCELDGDRYIALKEELLRLSSTPLCQQVEITFDEMALPPPLEAPPVPRRLQRRADPVYLILRQESVAAGRFEVRSSLLTTGHKATVISGSREVTRQQFDARIAAAAADEVETFDEVGADLAELLLSEDVKRVLPRFREHHLVVVHDAPLSRVPWETLAFPDDTGAVWFPSAEYGMSHRYAAENLSVTKWLEERIHDDVLNLLLVVDPTRDLQGARIEGKRVLELFRNQPGCAIDQLYQREATRPALLAAFGSGKYDVIHYAGHAFFDPRKPERSGILCHGKVPLTGADLAGLGNLPTLVFFNACESARVRTLREASRRTRASAKTIERDRRTRVEQAAGLAEAFMRGGVANFIGTYWPVGDAAAESFAREFYGAALRGETVGDALQLGRRNVRDLPSRDWADYVFYGNPDFVLKDVMPGVRATTEEIDPNAGTDVPRGSA